MYPFVSAICLDKYLSETRGQIFKAKNVLDVHRAFNADKKKIPTSDFHEIRVFHTDNFTYNLLIRNNLDRIRPKNILISFKKFIFGKTQTPTNSPTFNVPDNVPEKYNTFFDNR